MPWGSLYCMVLYVGVQRCADGERGALERRDGVAARKGAVVRFAVGKLFAALPSHPPLRRESVSAAVAMGDVGDASSPEGAAVAEATDATVVGTEAPSVGGSRRPSRSAVALTLALQRQRALEAKRHLNALQRSLIEARGRGAANDAKAKKREVGQSMRAEARRNSLSTLLADSSPASEEEVTRLSMIFNRRMRELFETPSWIKLSRAINTDNSGQITYNELLALTRDEAYLGLLSADVSEDQLKAFWLSLDEDRSGFISCGEFGSFMRRGEHALNPRTTWREKLEDKNRLAAEQRRAERDDLFGRNVVKSVGQIAPADEALVAALATMCNAKVMVLHDRNEKESAPTTWFGLFKRVDSDSSGLITFAEWSKLVRGELGLGEHEMGQRDLKAVWVALDTDSSGFISAAEWAAFMRKGEQPEAQNDRKERIALARKRMAATVREQDAVLALQCKEVKQRDDEARRSKAKRDREKRRQHRELAKSALAERNNAARQGVRARVDQTNLRNELKSAPRATDEQILKLAEACNKQLLVNTAGEDVGPSWYRLFKSVDRDGSGQISFDEFVLMLRQDLRLANLGFNRDTIKATWATIDEDSSGFISCGEFGRFMRRGTHVLPHDELTWREKIELKAKEAKRKNKEDKDRLFHLPSRHEFEAVSPATDGEVKSFSGQLNARLEMRNHAARRDAPFVDSSHEAPSTAYGRWYALFKSADKNSNGYISFVELKNMVRDELGLPLSTVSDDLIRAVWRRLDKEGSGLLAAGDFIQFMRLGDKSDKAPSVQEMRVQRGGSARRAYEQQLERLKQAQADNVERQARASERQAARLERELRSTLRIVANSIASDEEAEEAAAPQSNSPTSAQAPMFAISAATAAATYSIAPSAAPAPSPAAPARRVGATSLPTLVEKNSPPAQARSTVEPARMRVRDEGLSRSPVMSATYHRQVAEGNRKKREQSTLNAYGGLPSGAGASAATKASRHLSGSASEGVLRLPTIIKSGSNTGS